MSEIAAPLIGTLLGCFSGGIITYVIGKRMLSDENILSKLDMILNEYSTNDEALKKIYTIGGILGKGVRDGVGLDRMLPKKKGGIEGFLMELAGNWIRGRMGNRDNGEPQQEVIEPERHQIDRTW